MNTGETENNPPGQWETGNTSIATVDSNGNVTGVYPGVTNVQEVLVNMPVDAGTICSQQYVPCPTESFAESPAQLPVYPQITGISIFTYGQSGSFVISGSGFNAWSVYSRQVAVHFSDYNISNGQVSGWIASDSEIDGSYYMGCGTRLDYQPGFWVVGQYADGGTLQTFSQTLPYALPGASGPTISFNGSPVTSVQSVVVGQQIALTGSQSLPNCMALQSQSWTQPTGTAIAGYTASTSAGSVQTLPSTNNTSSANFYWVYPGNPLSVNYQTVLSTTSGDGFTETSPVGIAEFNVSGPTGGTMSVTPYSSSATIADLSACSAPPMNAGPYMIYATGAVGSACPGGLTGVVEPGMSFDNPTGYQNAANGSFSLVQLISSDVVNGITSSVGLDTGYPYGVPDTNDNPSLYLPPNSNTGTRSFVANMFLMWQSSTANSIPVPLGYQQWGFTSTATCSSNCGVASNWSVSTSSAGPIGGFQPSSSSQSSAGNNILVYGFPTWSTVSK